MNEPKSIREIIKTIQNAILTAKDLSPDMAAEYLNKLSAVYGNVLDEIQVRQLAYNQVLLLAYDTETKANRAKIKAETDPTYTALMEARNTEKLTLELIRSLKYYLRNKADEYQISGNQ